MTTKQKDIIKQQVTEVQTELKRLGKYTASIDGDAGPLTWKAIHTHIVPADENYDELRYNDWPLEKNARKFFGYPPYLTSIKCPYTMRMYDDKTKKWLKVTKITCNVKIAASLTRIFNAIYKAFDKDMALIRKANADVYDGCYNDRNISGSGKKSMHAFGAAIDLDAEHNGIGSGKGKIDPRIVKIFKAEGWRWGGDYTKKSDPMHFEACK